ncbi:putative serine peptidase [Aspergillus fijiensis CBS 313.89]|uniref:Endoprotease endo-Pro n=1 Tax=Aspergillus fijiensis CBS 313.89 TaxID=1448319 RepID=A0A8G1W2B0_9EURO|nr:endoprotease endo-Pro [Aspergillus fijiensis CBS 313.89]RAK80281.1 endoprotease endo-Pro [Aspergillus fijiensis CBS 313.89]
MRFCSPVSLVAVTALWASLAAAVRPPRLAPRPIAATSQASESSVVESTFEQLIDHSDPSKGTFSQRYWYSAQYWGGPGSPVVLFTPGEVSADGYQGYLTNSTLTGVYAQQLQGAVVLVEHRYWGGSSPYTNLTAETLQYLTLEQSVLDLTYFAENVKLGFARNSTSSNAPHVPWVLVGGSYSGALTAWTEHLAPGTFWAYHATSAPVESIYDFWQYFRPIQDGMAKNCSKDVSLVAEHVDKIGKSGTKAQQTELKKLFGLEALEHFDDFAAVLPVGPYLWQDNTFATGYSGFFAFCDAVENVEAGAAVTPGAEGVGLEKALTGYANWFKNEIFPGYCASYGYWSDEYSVACYDTYNTTSPLFTDTSVDNAVDRQWQWFLCNEPFFWWQDGAPSSETTLIPRLVSADYWQRQCALYFPEVNGFTYGSAKGKSASTFNAWTDGWFLNGNSTRLIWTNGQYDPWRDATVSSTFRPGGPLASTPSEPVQIIPGGFHCSDLYISDSVVNAGVKKVVNNEVSQIKAWVAEFYA